MPMAAASTGTRKFDLRALSHSSSAMIAAPMAAPMAIIVHGSLPPNMPLATEAISVACGAASELGCSGVGAPMPARESVVEGKSVAVRVDLGGRRIMQKK